jgi:HEXXH motif-containing protein
LSCAFKPSAARGLLIDETVRISVAESISVLSQPILAECPDFRPLLEHWIASLRAGPMRPGVFAIYSDLVESIFSENEPAFLSAMGGLAGLNRDATDLNADTPDELRAVTLADDELGPGMASRFVRHLDDDPTTPLAVAPVAAQELASAKQRLAETCLLLDSAVPELIGEIRRLVRDIIFVVSEPRSGELVFHGASTFYLWGALFLNMRRHPDRVSMAEGLTHEAAHSLLLGYTLGAPLVENDASERFPSPLREDLRPMDGIVHATYVLARMHYCIERLLSSDALTDLERDQLEAAKRRRKAEYLDGLNVVASHARFTDAGTAIFAGAQKYMAQACAAS